MRSYVTFEIEEYKINQDTMDLFDSFDWKRKKL